MQCDMARRIELQGIEPGHFEEENSTCELGFPFWFSGKPQGGVLSQLLP